MESKKNKNKEKEKENELEKPQLSYENLWKVIIRPSRDNYTLKELGPPSFVLKNKNYSRKDFNLLGSNGNILKCTFFELDEIDRKVLSLPVIIYLHGNSGSRVDCMKYLRIVLENDINLFCFDFAGCGLSEGEYISLGHHEKEDLKIIINFVSNLPNVASIGLWGHSMGAATAILCAAETNRISCVCADSSFADFLVLAQELTKENLKLPNFIISTAISFLRKVVINKNGLDIYHLKPIEAVQNIKVPVMFVHGFKDALINIHHSVELFDKCKGSPKFVNFFEGGHNTKRDKEVNQKVIEFFKNYLNKENYQI